MKYRKKPVVVEAVQWFKDGDHPGVELQDSDFDRFYGYIGTPEDGYDVYSGDWIIGDPVTDVLSDEDFHATYDEVVMPKKPDPVCPERGEWLQPGVCDD